MQIKKYETGPKFIKLMLHATDISKLTQMLKEKEK